MVETVSGVTEWVVLELTPKSEGEDPDIIKASIRHILRGAEVFIPASVVERGPVREFKYLVDGYAFVLHKHPDAAYYRLEDTKYVQNPLYQVKNKRERRLATVTGAQIEKLRSQIVVDVDQGIEVGDTVFISSGPYRNILARVCEEIHEHDSVVVHIQLRSTSRLVTLPRAFLRLEAKSAHHPYRDALRRLSNWSRGALRVVRWSDAQLREIHRLHSEASRLDHWVAATQRNAVIGAHLTRPIDLTTSTLKLCDLALLEYYVRKLDDARSAVAEALSGQPRLNLIIDGTQLFIRCAETPGLSALTDKQGRRTGATLGFLRSLAAYKKRFPDAHIYVTWDGTSTRRKEMYSGYKANRLKRVVSAEHQPAFGWEWLRQVLPLLGVVQVYNAKEEADDVMASLVRGALRDSTNILITSDRDLLQLVSATTYQLCPAVGGSKEKLYDPPAVEREYGVAPESLIQLRALSGDKSDHIPGVLGFGLMTAAKVIKVYGTVAALFKSNLAGMTKKQTKSLRASEGQVRLNVELLGLKDVKYTSIDSQSDQSEAEKRIKDLSIKPEALLAAFFPLA